MALYVLSATFSETLISRAKRTTKGLGDGFASFIYRQETPLLTIEMNETDLPDEKIDDEEPVGVTNERASGKRGRDDDRESGCAESPLKIRKKFMNSQSNAFSNVASSLENNDSGSATEAEKSVDRKSDGDEKTDKKSDVTQSEAKFNKSGSSKSMLKINKKLPDSQSSAFSNGSSSKNNDTGNPTVTEKSVDGELARDEKTNTISATAHLESELDGEFGESKSLVKITKKSFLYEEAKLPDARSTDVTASIDVATSSENNGTACSTGKSVEEKLIRDETADKMSAVAQLEAEFDGDFVDFFDDTFHEDNTDAIELEEFQYCIIAAIEREKKFTKIWVKDSAQKSSATVLCYDFWKDVKVEKNDVVSLKARKESDYWVINNDSGFLVTKPHNLITGTSIVQSNFCLRRGVLQHSFRGLDAVPGVQLQDQSMTIGTLVHEVLQQTLRKKVSLIPEIGKIVDEVLSTRRSVGMLYDSNISLRDCKQQLKAYVPKIFNFVNRYVLGNTGHVSDNNFTGKIERIREIEENVWLPSLGIRGKMDVTVDVTVDLQRKIMPLEVKTGRASFSCEHRGQVVLYNMMLRYTGQKVDSGLLLYIRENMMHEIKSKHNDERDLILLRNSYANYVTQVQQFDEVTREDGKVDKVWKEMELPEPINHRFSCTTCPYNTLCSVYADKDANLELPESHAVRTIHREAVKYLTTEHVDYVMRWITMVKLEDNAQIDVTSTGNLWTLEPRMREENGTGVCNLTVCEKVVQEDNRYLHTFGRKDSDEEFALTDFTQSRFSDGEYLIVSTDTRVNVSAGYLKSKTKNKIQMLLDRNIVRQNPNATFHVDQYPWMATPTLNLANVACLLNNHDNINKLRTIIIDKKPASFVQKLPKSVAEIGAGILFRLNKYQRQAVLRVLAANDYLLIKGMPGTGKTQTLVALIDLLVKTGRSVLVTAHTHSAVDNILLKLNEKGIDFMRLGSKARINPAIMHKSEEVLTGDCKSPESLDWVYNSKKVVGVTCLGSSHGQLLKRIFDVCLVDEASQVMQSIVLRPIYSASKFVLVGDPEQLSPVIRSRDASKLGMNESLFERLDSENNTVTLKLQYRMNRKIMSVSNEITYKGNMKAANDDVATATLRIKDTMVLESCERWVSKALSINLEDSVVVLNTGETFSLSSKFDIEDKCRSKDHRVRNVFEAAIIVRLVAALLKGGVGTKSIGVICPFTSQVEFVRGICPEIETNTVDQYQGRDKEIIIYSCTRSMPRESYQAHEMDILQDRNRLNVAVTRAKHKLIIIGDKMSLEQHYPPFTKLFSVLKDDIVDLEPGRDDFSWESLLQLIK